MTPPAVTPPAVMPPAVAVRADVRPTVLVENGAYRMDNMGDVAMLQLCVGRIRARWPQARIRVLIETPDRLLAAVPGVEALAPARWHATRAMPYKLRFPGSHRFERRAQLHLPTLAYLGRRRMLRHDHERRDGIERLYQAVRTADVAVCSGGGFLTDWHVEHGDKVLHTLGLVQAFGRPTAMFGAGLGPLTDPDVCTMARTVLGRLDVLALREEAGNRAELAALGVRGRGVAVTGDDAIEPAYDARPAALGGGIGVCVRLAAHSQAPRERVPALGQALQAAAAALDAPLVPAPVRNHLSPDNDVDAMRAMFAAAPVPLDEATRVATPMELVRIVGRCRVMVTGAYHAAVFALSQGIPVVALVGTEYYDRKFGGLREQFGEGMEMLRYDEPELPERLRRAVQASWESAPRQRAALLQAAERQIALGRRAYDDFFTLAERRLARRRAGRAHPRAAVPAAPAARGSAPA